MSKFIYDDVKSAFEYAKTNPDKDISDWLEFRRLTISEKDLKEFNDIKYYPFTFKLDGKDFTFYLFVSPSNTMSNFITRFVGEKGYYDFYPGGGYGYYTTIISFDEEVFDYNKWGKYEDFKKLYCLNNTENNMMLLLNYIDYDNDNDTEDYQKYITSQRKLNNECYHFWNNGIDIYISDDIFSSNFPLRSIGDLFNIQ